MVDNCIMLVNQFLKRFKGIESNQRFSAKASGFKREAMFLLTYRCDEEMGILEGVVMTLVLSSKRVWRAS